MIIKFFIVILFYTSIYAGEVSVFGAGDISSSVPYGLTSAEKHILKNKKELDNLDSNIKRFEYSLKDISDRIDGLESILEGDNTKIHTIINELNNLSLKETLDNELAIKENKKIYSLVDNLSSRQIEIKKTQAHLISLINNIKDNQAKSINLINKINNRYISLREFKSNMSQFVTRKEFDKLINLLDTQAKSNKQNINLSNTDRFKKAKKLYNNRKFLEAIPIYEKLINSGYKIAESNYMLGRIFYIKEKYNTALSYFKATVVKDDKGWWMPELLLDSAVSFKKIGDLDNSSSFYSSLLELYPETKQAKIANKNILK